MFYRVTAGLCATIAIGEAAFFANQAYNTALWGHGMLPPSARGSLSRRTYDVGCAYLAAAFMSGPKSQAHPRIVALLPYGKPKEPPASYEPPLLPYRLYRLAPRPGPLGPSVRNLGRLVPLSDEVDADELREGRYHINEENMMIIVPKGRRLDQVEGPRYFEMCRDHDRPYRGINN